MQLTTEQLKTYEDRGYLFFPSYFSPEEIDRIKAEVPNICSKELPGKVLEEDGTTLRMVHGVHKENEVFQRLSQHPKVVTPIMQMLNSSIYVHQFKINAKKAFNGEVLAMASRLRLFVAGGWYTDTSDGECSDFLG